MVEKFDEMAVQTVFGDALAETVDSFLELGAVVFAATVLMFTAPALTTALLFDVAGGPLFENTIVDTVEWPFEDADAVRVKLLLEDAAVLTMQLLLDGTALFAADFDGSALVAEEMLFKDVEQVTVAGTLFEGAALVTVEQDFEEITEVTVTELFFEEELVLVTAPPLLDITEVVPLPFC